MLSTTIVAAGIDDRTAQHLANTGHTLDTVGPDAETLFGRMVAAPADALILGNHCDLDGAFVERLRAHRIDTPAIRIADGPRDPSWSQECAHFLDCGGDDVIVGPPNPEEVALSVRTVCRRAKRVPDHIVRFWEERSGTLLEVNLTKSTAVLNGRPFSATAYELLLLFTLADAVKPLCCEELRQKLHWDERPGNTVEVMVSHLRKKLGQDLLPTAQPGPPAKFESCKRRGYALVGRIH